MQIGQRFLATVANVRTSSPSNAGGGRVRRITLPSGLVPDDGEPLDMLVLGMDIGSSMGSVECALCEFRQESPESPLSMKLVKVWQ